MSNCVYCRRNKMVREVRSPMTELTWIACLKCVPYPAIGLNEVNKNLALCSQCGDIAVYVARHWSGYEGDYVCEEHSNLYR